ncbi:conserved hypothetical protein [Vibrio phage 236O40-1]|nr:conserved hypothetical protein [Vibrio phage 236O40-1]
MSKESLTGYLNRTNDAGKLENMIFVQEGSLYYLPSFGIDRDFFIGSEYPIESDSFISYIRQKSLVNGIVTSSIDINVVDNVAKVLYAIASESQQQDFNVSQGDL